MNNPIEIIPALKRVRLKRVGCWDELAMEFIPGLNIITDDSRGSGKSTIFRAIKTALHPSEPLNYPLSPTQGFSEGEISVELMSSTIALCIPGSVNTRSELEGCDRMKIFRSQLEAAQLGQAVLVESHIFEQFDDAAFAEVAKLLAAPRCQIICIMSRRLKPEQFDGARIYSCFWNEEADRAGVRMQQAGMTKS
jgi:energy-coupling factor transporter ATP-binding protein EcfA2